jgi:hypothetical protein
LYSTDKPTIRGGWDLNTEWDLSGKTAPVKGK